MEKIELKTNINCGGCIATVTPFLEKDKRIVSWNVDTNSKDKLLTVMGEGINAEEVKQIISSAGFKVKEQ